MKLRNIFILVSSLIPLTMTSAALANGPKLAMEAAEAAKAARAVLKADKGLFPSVHVSEAISIELDTLRKGVASGTKTAHDLDLFTIARIPDGAYLSETEMGDLRKLLTEEKTLSKDPDEIIRHFMTKRYVLIARSHNGALISTTRISSPERANALVGALTKKGLKAAYIEHSGMVRAFVRGDSQLVAMIQELKNADAQFSFVKRYDPKVEQEKVIKKVAEAKAEEAALEKGRVADPQNPDGKPIK